MSENKVLEYEMDKRWESYSPPYTQEIFKISAEKLIAPSGGVPELIKKKLERVRSVYELRSIDFELQAVAEHLTYVVLELSLRMKFEEINKKTTKKSLGSLLHWAKKEGELSISEDRIKFLCGLRNDFAHLRDPESLHGTLSSFLIDELVKLINELFRDSSDTE
ncbi:hypothetical protein IQ255_29260 [Pleurocapsales cyanobacterium LEGE 10410]|nr:hypothetical protein [Pleurocapsales cyanobacterium LEGE 10410]